jgi:hypothetical protein
VPEPPPPPRSAGKWSGVVLRLEFVFPEKGVRHCGTGFVIQDRTRQCYLMTCAHLIDDRDWQTRHSVFMRTMDGSRVIESFGLSLHFGNAVDLKHAGPHGRYNMTTDLVIRSVAGSWTHPLPLARTDPAPGDWVWVVGNESSSPPGPEKLFPGRVLEVSDGGYILEKAVPFNPRGFSGGPIVNRRGEVVGNVLAGGGKTVQGATVGTLRRRLTETGIKVERN